MQAFWEMAIEFPCLDKAQFSIQGNGVTLHLGGYVSGAQFGGNDPSPYLTKTDSIKLEKRHKMFPPEVKVTSDGDPLEDQNCAIFKYLPSDDDRGKSLRKTMLSSLPALKTNPAC